MDDEHTTLETLVRQALDGDKHAIETIARRLQPSTYALALRMLWNPHDAEDATQEILVRVVTRLALFDFKSSLRTWVFRVATNYLLDVKKSCAEQQRLTFESFADDLAQGLSSEGPSEGELSMLTEEVKLGCTLGMLQCLDREHRLAYVLGEIMEVEAPEAAEALSIHPSAFRKRLQRARERIEAFTSAHCGIVSESAACSCHRRVNAAVRSGRARQDKPSFAAAPSSFVEARKLVRSIEETRRVAELHRGIRPVESRADVARAIVSAMTSAQT